MQELTGAEAEARWSAQSVPARQPNAVRPQSLHHIWARARHGIVLSALAPLDPLSATIRAFYRKWALASPA